MATYFDNAIDVDIDVLFAKRKKGFLYRTRHRPTRYVAPDKSYFSWSSWNVLLF